MARRAIQALLLLSALQSCFVAAQVFQWRDALGRVYFGDQPPEGVGARPVAIDRSLWPAASGAHQGGVQAGSTPQPRATPDTEALLDIRLPQPASVEQVRAYIQRIFDASRNQRTYLATDPQVGKLAAVGYAHRGLLLEVVHDGVPWSVYAVEAINLLATDADQQDIIAALPARRKLVKVVYRKGWSRAARTQLIQGIRGYSGYLPSEWLQALVALQDETVYPDLLRYFVHGWNRHITYNIIRPLQGIEITTYLPQAWENALRQGRGYELNALTADTVATGYVPALEYVIDQFDAGAQSGRSGLDARRIALRYLDIRGDNDTIRRWFARFRDQLVFDSGAGKFRVKASIAPS